MHLQGVAQVQLSSDYSYNVSEPYKLFDAERKLYLSKNNEVMVLKFARKEVLIQKFNTEKPSLVKEKTYQNFFPENYSVEKIIESNDKYYFIFSSWDGNKEKEQLFFVAIDFSKGEFIGTPKLLFQVNGKIQGEYTGAFVVGNKFDIMQSQDKKNIVVQYKKMPLIKDDAKSFAIIGLYTYDGNLNKVSGNEITMPYTERRMKIMDCELDNSGNLYMINKVYHNDTKKDKSDGKDIKINYHIELFLIKAGSIKIEVSKFENKDKFINELHFFGTDKDFLVCSGFYGDGGDAGDWRNNGITTFKVKSDGRIFDQVFQKIPSEVVIQYEREKDKKWHKEQQRKGNPVGLPDLVLRDLRINEDGSFVIIGEEYDWDSDLGATYSDILVSKIKADGELAWMKRIPKEQKSSGGETLSFKYFNMNGNHYFVFLDNIKNIDLPLNKEPFIYKDGKEGYLTAVKIADSDGALSKGSILNVKDVNGFETDQFVATKFFKTSENSFMLEVRQNHKENEMIKVSLN